MLNEREIDKLLEGEIREVYYVAHINEVANPFMDFIHYTTKPTYVVVKMYVDRIANALVEYELFMSNPSKYEYVKESMWYSDGIKHDIKFYANIEAEKNAYMPAGILGGEHTVYSEDDETVKTKSSIFPEIPIEYTNERSIINDRKYHRLKSPMIIDGKNYEYSYSKYYVIKAHSTSMNKSFLIKIGDKNQVFIDLDDALACANELEA